MMSDSQSMLPSAVVKSRKAKRYTEADRAHHLEEWKKSGTSMSQYCQDKELSISSLSKWAKCGKKAKIPFKSVGLLPASIQDQNSDIEVIIDNRIKIKLSSVSTIPLAVNLVRSLVKCN